MILVNGNIMDSENMNEHLPSLEKRICRTLQKPVLNPLVVVEACDKFALQIERNDYFDSLKPLITGGQITDRQLQEVVNLFKKESLLYKLETELGEFYLSSQNSLRLSPPYYDGALITRRLMPLGALFHIAAGNVDGLPAYSVIEGLLAGNVNILKLPAADQGFTIQLLYELIKIEPLLAEYIYVFDTPSSDTAGMQTMAKCADAIVVWGGDTATLAVRKLASPNTKIIEWGHKMSFAYVTKQGMKETDLTILAHHILSTKQLLCSSCQGIYIDTDDILVIHDFCQKFIRILETTAQEYPVPGIGMQAQLTLLLYNKDLEAATKETRIFRGRHCSLIATKDRKLEVSFTHGNCWVKPLPRKNIIGNLHRYKGYLQTVGLLCAPSEREALSEQLCRAGATRITYPGEMSRMLCGEAHDGEYPLMRYSKIVEY